jgi:hypothetical protein
MCVNPLNKICLKRNTWQSKDQDPKPSIDHICLKDKWQNDLRKDELYHLRELLKH